MSRSLKGWRFAAFLGTLVGSIGLAIYPIIIAPLMNHEEYREINERNRALAGIDSNKTQPGNMNVWKDPFDRK